MWDPTQEDVMMWTVFPSTESVFSGAKKHRLCGRCATFSFWQNQVLSIYLINLVHIVCFLLDSAADNASDVQCLYVFILLMPCTFPYEHLLHFKTTLHCYIAPQPKKRLFRFFQTIRFGVLNSKYISSKKWNLHLQEASALLLLIILSEELAYNPGFGTS